MGEPLAQPVTLVKMVHPVALVLLDHGDLQEPPDLTVLPVPLAKEDSPDQLELLEHLELLEPLDLLELPVLEDSTVLMVAPELLVLPVKTDLLELLAVMAQSDPLEHLVPLVKMELLVALVRLVFLIAELEIPLPLPKPVTITLHPNRDSPSKLPCLDFESSRLIRPQF